MSTRPLYLQDCGIITPLGCGKADTARALFSGNSNGIIKHDGLISNRSIHVGAVQGNLPALPAGFKDLDSRNNRLMQVALMEIAPVVENTIARYGKGRIAVILGTSTSGISDSEDALAIRQKTEAWPVGYHYSQQEISSLSTFAAQFFGLTGPVYTVATACSSSAKVFASARRLIRAGLVDAAIVGGADTLCRMTLGGFGSLELLSDKKCNPFSANRKGITIGEGASAFLMTKDEGPVELLGIGETSDAHHPTTPDPDGGGAQQAMKQALGDAGLRADEIAYINLHGTATQLNDAMEARAVHAIFGTGTPCSSTKGMTGHMLGATGGCEAAFMWLALNSETNPKNLLPPHVWDGVRDAALPVLNFATTDMKLPQGKQLAMLSNSFGFGGSNAAIILGQS